MKLLAAFILIGTVDSIEKQFVSVDVAVKNGCDPVVFDIPLELFPCEIKEGDKFRIIKLTEYSEPVIICNEK